jgi:hypothetical protein
MGEIKTEHSQGVETETKNEELTYEEKLEYCNAISKPMASKKLTKKCYKLVKKGEFKFRF